MVSFARTFLTLQMQNLHLVGVLVEWQLVVWLYPLSKSLLLGAVENVLCLCLGNFAVVLLLERSIAVLLLLEIVLQAWLFPYVLLPLCVLSRTGQI